MSITRVATEPLRPGFHALKEAGVQGEIAAAKKVKDAGEVIEEVSVRIAGGDLLTRTKAIEVKGGGLNNGPFARWGAQLDRLKKHAEAIETFEKSLAPARRPR